jgi:hypothetical protein
MLRIALTARSYRQALDRGERGGLDVGTIDGSAWTIANKPLGCSATRGGATEPPLALDHALIERWLNGRPCSASKPERDSADETPVRLRLDAVQLVHDRNAEGNEA